MENLVTLDEAAKILKIDRRKLYHRVYQAKRRGKNYSLHQGRRKDVFIDLDK